MLGAQSTARAAPGSVAAPRAQRELRPDVRQRLAALHAGSSLRVNAHTGALSRLRGHFALAGADLSARGADFARRFGPLFNGDGGAAFGATEIVSRDGAGRPTWVRVPQLVQGFPLEGHSLLLRLDGAGAGTGAGANAGAVSVIPDHVREVHGILLPGTATVAPPSVNAAAARLAALTHLKLDETALMAAPGVAGRARVAADGSVQLVQRVELVTRAGLRPLAVDIDAHSGAVLGVRDNRSFGTGNLLWDGVALPLTTGNGKGYAYASVANALAGKETGASLRELTLQDVSEAAFALNGTLTGRYAKVSGLDVVLVSPSRIFPVSDSSSASLGPIVEYEAFDHVNTYFWITRMAAWLGKVQRVLASDTCIPAIVNYDDEGSGFINAFYSPQDLDEPGSGFSPGFFVFGDFDALTGDPADDFSRDPSVVCHEYTHGMVDKAGFSFGDGELDTPSRAVNEAIADYAAASFLRDPRIGPVVVAHSGADLALGGDALRNLDAPITLPDNLTDTLGGTGLPEEHEAGEIFGAALWSARTALKAKIADDMILRLLRVDDGSPARAGHRRRQPEERRQAARRVPAPRHHRHGRRRAALHLHRLGRPGRPLARLHVGVSRRHHAAPLRTGARSGPVLRAFRRGRQA
jgi:hypothetical protein